MPCLSQVYVYKSKCVYIYSGNSTILVLDNRRWGADSTSTSFPPVPGAHSCGWPGQMFSAPICTVPRMAYVVINGNRLSKHGPLCFQILPRPGSHLGHREIKPFDLACTLRARELSRTLALTRRLLMRKAMCELNLYPIGRVLESRYYLDERVRSKSS